MSRKEDREQVMDTGRMRDTPRRNTPTLTQVDLFSWVFISLVKNKKKYQIKMNKKSYNPLMYCLHNSLNNSKKYQINVKKITKIYEKKLFNIQ